MRVAELKALAREHGLRGYSRLRKAELIALIRPPPAGEAPPSTPRTRPPRRTRGPWPPLHRGLHLPHLHEVDFLPHLHVLLGLDEIDQDNLNL